MEKEERTKIEIERLQAQSDYQKFEYSQYITFFIGLLATLITVIIPVILYFTEKKDFISVLFVVIISLILIWTIHQVVSKWSNKNLIKIKGLSKKIEYLYNQLLTWKK